MTLPRLRSSSILRRPITPGVTSPATPLVPPPGSLLSDATSRFRVTFKESGTFNVTIQLVAVDGGDVILRTPFPSRAKWPPP